MENLYIEKTKNSMCVDFNKDTGILEMSGSCFPEHAVDFFGVVHNWISNYLAMTNKKTVVNVRLNYINTSSTKCMLDIFEMFNLYYINHHDIRVNWYYAEDDEDILETGEELGEGLELPIEYIPY